MTQAQIQTRIDKMRFTYLGKDEEYLLKSVLSGINLATGSGVSSVFGRSGAVTAQSGDYSFSLISGTAGPTQGGTGLTTYAKGDVLIATGTNILGVVGASVNDGYVFTWDAATGLPKWKAASGGGVDTTADYTWTGVHTFSKSLSGTQNDIILSPTITATANNQQLAAMNINPTFNVGAYTGVKQLGIFSTAALYFNTGGGQPSIYMNGGGSIMGASSTGGGYSLVGALDGTGTISIGATIFSVGANLNTTGTNTFSKGITINTGSDLLKSNAISLLGNKQTFDNINGLQIAWNKSGGSRENYIVSSASATSSDLGNAGDIMFGYWIGGTGGSLTTYGGWKKSGSFLIGTTTEGSSSLLTLASTTKGFLPPRMTTTQKNAITSPAEGLVLYDNVLKKLCLYNGTAWETITSA